MPFEMNTTIRYSSVFFSQTCAGCFHILIMSIMVSFVFGICIYTEAILIDIKSLFNRIDRQSKSNGRSAKLTMLEYCKEAIELYGRMSRYLWCHRIAVVIFKPFSTVACTSWPI